MAKQLQFNIKVNVDGKEQVVKVSTDIDKLGQKLGVTGKQAKNAGTALKAMTVGVAFANVSTAIQQVTATLEGLTEATKVQIENETRLRTVMQQRMAATEQDIKGMFALASAQQEIGIIGDEVQLAGMQQVATFLTQKESLEMLTPAMNDLIAQQKGYSATAGDAQTIGNLLGKAMQGQVTALRRVGISFNESQANILKYGNEQQKAATLAQVVTQNVGHMNSKLAQTPTGKMKQLENSLGDVKEQLGAMVEGVMPFLTMAASATIAINGVVQLVTVTRTAIAAVGGLNIGLRLQSGLMWMVGASGNSTAAVMKVLTGAFTSARYAGIALRMALRGLLIATGVGAAITALTWAISKLMDSSKEAEESTDDLSDSVDSSKDAYVQASSSIAINIERLKNFKGTQAEEKKMVDEMNQTYGNTIGYFDSVSQWYHALTADSAAYCDQMVREAQIRDLANQTAKIEQENHGLLYNSDGSRRRYSTKREDKYEYMPMPGSVVGGTWVKVGGGVKGSSDQEKASAQVASNNRKIASNKRLMQQLAAQNTYYPVRGHEAPTGHSHAAPAGAGTGGHTTTRKGQGTANTTSTDHEDNLTKNSIAYYEKQISDLRDKAENIDLKLEPQVYQETMRQVAELEQKVEAIRKSAGQDIHTPGDVDGKPGRLTDNLPEIDTNIELPTIPDNIPKDAATAADAVNGLTGAFRGLGEAMGGSAQGWLSWGANVVSTVWSTLPALEALINALFAKSAADSVEQNSKLGPFGWVAGIAAALSVVAAMASLPKFAEGGLAYGPTLGLFGEYSGASHNPEVVAPLDKLRGLLAPAQGGGTARVEFVARGRDLVGVLANETRIGSKSGVRTKIKL